MFADIRKRCLRQPAHGFTVLIGPLVSFVNRFPSLNDAVCPHIFRLVRLPIAFHESGQITLVPGLDLTIK